jgi:hypothetical protein
MMKRRRKKMSETVYVVTAFNYGEILGVCVKQDESVAQIEAIRYLVKKANYERDYWKHTTETNGRMTDSEINSLFLESVKCLLEKNQAYWDGSETIMITRSRWNGPLECPAKEKEEEEDE